MTTKKRVEVGSRRGTGFLNLLFLVFLVLKLTDVIDWSWWWVTAPLWGPWAAVGLVLVALAVLKILVWRGERKLRRLRRARGIL